VVLRYIFECQFSISVVKIAVETTITRRTITKSLKAKNLVIRIMTLDGIFNNLYAEKKNKRGKKLWKNDKKCV